MSDPTRHLTVNIRRSRTTRNCELCTDLIKVHGSYAHIRTFYRKKPMTDTKWCLACVRKRLGRFFKTDHVASEEQQ